LVCTSCHQARAADALKPSHHPLHEGKMGCTSCHSPHGSTAPSALKGNTVTETCTTCHAENRGPFLWEHEPVSEDCSNCHDAHGSTQPSLFKDPSTILVPAMPQRSGPSLRRLWAGRLTGGGGVERGVFLQAGSCLNCHSKVHGSNHPSGSKLMR
jgi:DmsE family decaheme c-type cytochrome